MKKISITILLAAAALLSVPAAHGRNAQILRPQSESIQSESIQSESIQSEPKQSESIESELIQSDSIQYAEPRQYRLSSHILDIDTGRPAAGVRIELWRMDDAGGWVRLEEHTTDGQGRVKEMLEAGEGDDRRGIYKLTYHVGPYFEARKQDTFYPFVEVVFEIGDTSHYHVPITLSPYGYSTYRGN